MKEARKILAVGLEREPFTELHPMLARSSLTAYRVSLGQSAFELADEIGFDQVLVGHPLHDLKLDDFLAILRRPQSASGGSEVLVLTDDATRPDLETFRAEEGSRLISFERPVLEVLEQVASRLGMARRLAQRVLARLEVKVEQRVEKLVCQSENVSATGILLKTDRDYPVGTRLALCFDLPSDGSRFECDGEVVRHVDEEREGLRGIGIRFLDVKPEATGRLEGFLKTLLAED